MPVVHPNLRAPMWLRLDDFALLVKALDISYLKIEVVVAVGYFDVR